MRTLRAFLAGLVSLALVLAPVPAAAQLTLTGSGKGSAAQSSGGGGGGASFTFVDRPNAVTSTLFTSAAVTMGTGSISISGSGCQYAVNGGSYTSSSGSVTAGDTVTVQVTSSGSLSTGVGCLLTNGAFSDTYTVTTLVNTEADAFLQRAITAASDPGATIDGYYDTLFTNLKSGPTCSCNLLSDLDVLYIFSTPSSAVALLNLVSTSYTATTTGSPSFSPNIGFSGNGDASGVGSAYINSNYNPWAGGVQFTQNSATMALYSQSNSTNTNWYDIGQPNGVTESSKLNARSAVTGTTLRGKGPNDGTFINWGATSRSDGWFAATRTGASAKQAWQNTTSLGTDSTASVALTSGNFIILANLATASQYSGRQLSAVLFGGGFTSAKNADAYAAIQAFMTSQGIPK